MKKLLLLLLLFVQISFAQINKTDSMYFDGYLRDYKTYVPAIYDSSNPVPLVINIHGLGSNMVQQELYGDFKNLADIDNFIIVHPNGTFDNTNTRYWNAFGAMGGVDDVAFINALIDTISVLYNIDSTKIFATGMSNGGFMSYKLACELSDRIAKIASVTGTMILPLINTCSPSKPIPVMQIHGTSDLKVPYNGGNGFLPIDEVIQYWVDFNNCDTTAAFTTLPDINTSDSSTVEKFEYKNGDDDSEVILYKITNGGHTWPGAVVDIPSNGNTNKDFNASKVIWEFFKGEEIVLSTNDKFQNEDFKLFVNQNQLSFSKNIDIESVTVVNALGQLLINTKNELVDITSLNKGVYFAIVQTKKGILSKSFYKQ